MKRFAILAMMMTAPLANAATQIEDDIKSPSVSAVQAMTNSSVSLDTVQDAFTESNPMANTATFQYSRGKVYKIYVREFMDTHIILPEPIRDFSLGDNVNFHWIPADAKNRGRVFFDNYNADTNLTLFGDSGAAYVFYIRAIPYNSSILPHLTAFVVNPAVTGTKSAPDEPVLSVGGKNSHFKRPNDGEYLRTLKDIDVTALDYNYETVGGNESLAPKYIFDDGVWTYFVYDKDSFDHVTRLPTFYRVVDGYDNPVNTRKQNGTVIAETTNDGWTLRHGSSHLCIRKVEP